MLAHLKGLLTDEEVDELGRQLDGVPFEDGRKTATGTAKERKNVLQAPEDHPVAREASRFLEGRLLASAKFQSLVQPRRFRPFRFCRYEPGMHYGDHYDAPIMGFADGSPFRSDLSMTVFLSPPGDYAGGELVLHLDYGVKRLKGETGDAVLYGANLLHRVEPVTEGVRLVAIAWLESLIRHPTRRMLLFRMMDNIVRLEQAHGPSEATRELRQCHGELLREWAET